MESHDAHQEQAGHQERGRDRPQDERAGRVHRCVAEAAPFALRRGRAGRGGRAGLSRLHFRAGLQLVDAFGHDGLARGEAFRDRGRVAFREPHLDGARLDGLILFHDEDERGLRAALDRGVRHEDDALRACR